MDNYHEIFLGGGSVLLFLSLRKQGKLTIKKIYAYDLNLLINVLNIKNNKDELFFIEKYITEYDSLRILK